MSTTHRVEAVIREASHAARASNRSEGACSEVVIERSMYWLNIREKLREEVAQKSAPRGKQVAVALAVKAMQRAVDKGELTALRVRAQEAGASCTELRQQAAAKRESEAYLKQVKLTRAEGGLRTAACDMAASEHSLTILGSGLSGTVKIKSAAGYNGPEGQGGFNARKVTAELRARDVAVPDKASTGQLKVLLYKHCSLVAQGFPDHFRWEKLTLAVQQAYNEIARLGSACAAAADSGQRTGS